MAALHNALTLLYTEEGIPNLFYGTEQDFTGGNDPANREVLWTTGFPTDGATFTHIAKLARIRKAYPALRRGDTKVLWSTTHVGSEPDAGLFAFERAGGDAGSGPYALVVLNTSSFQRSSAALQTSQPPGTKLVDVADPQQASYDVDGGGKLNASVPLQSAMILVPASQVAQGG